MGLSGFHWAVWRGVTNTARGGVAALAGLMSPPPPHKHHLHHLPHSQPLQQLTSSTSSTWDWKRFPHCGRRYAWSRYPNSAPQSLKWLQTLERLILSHLLVPGHTSTGPPAVCLPGVQRSRQCCHLPATQDLFSPGSSCKLSEHHVLWSLQCFYCNTNSPLMLGDRSIQVNSPLSWITDYLTRRPHFVKLRNWVSGTVMSNMGG